MLLRATSGIFASGSGKSYYGLIQEQIKMILHSRMSATNDNAALSWDWASSTSSV
jgi:hypothetical protein